MTGLPQAQMKGQERSVVTLLFCRGIENLTRSLMRGDPFSEDALNDMLQIQRRLAAFSGALDARRKAMKEAKDDK